LSFASYGKSAWLTKSKLGAVLLLKVKKRLKNSRDILLNLSISYLFPDLHIKTGGLVMNICRTRPSSEPSQDFTIFI
jgi:hypothetical protein